jgi:hypothetical protein
MTLAPGTALQHGHYVIDAPALEDSLGPLYLATHISQGRRVLVRVLGSRQPQNIPPAAQRSDFFSYLQSVQALRISLLPKQVEGFEEEGVCYQVLSTPAGSPLSQQLNPDQPLPLPQALTLLNALTDSLQALRSLGWLALCLEPDQIWWAPDRFEATWIGFDLPSHPLPSREETEAVLVRQLGHLLYFLLTGCHVSHTQAPLDVDLCHRHPGLPDSLVRALQLATDSPPATLTEWSTVLPKPQPMSMALVTPGPSYTNGHRPPGRPPMAAESGPALKPFTPLHLSSQPAPTLAQGQQSKVYRGWSRWATYGLMATAIGAGLSGLVVGLHLRTQTLDPSQASRFNPNQSFPPLADWNGNRADTKAVRPFNRPLRQPDYGDAPQPAPTPSAGVTRPYPAVTPARPAPAQSATPSLPSAGSPLLENPAPLSSDGSLPPTLEPSAEPTPPAMSTPTPSANVAPPSPSPVGSGTVPEPITAPPPAVAPAPSPSSSPVNL